MTNDIELVTTEKVSKGCSRAVKPIYGFAELNELGIQVNEGTLLGGIGVFTKEAPILCGGRNGIDTLKTCWEFNYNINKLVAINHLQTVLDRKINPKKT